MVLLDLGRLEEAHENIDRADRLFRKLGDRGAVAQVGDTRARIYLAAHEYQLAVEVARSTVDVLSQGE